VLFRINKNNSKSKNKKQATNIYLSFVHRFLYACLDANKGKRFNGVS
jgi:hypothetical protein